MKISINCIAAALLLVLATGCEMNNRTTVNGTGPIVEKTLTLGDFSKINLTGVANFYVTIGEPQQVVLKAQQNIIDVMKLEVTEQTLRVGTKDNVSIGSHAEIRFDITVPSMSMIFMRGVGNFTLSGSDQDNLSITLTGVGDVKSFDMRAGSCKIKLTGVGNCQVYAINKLDVTITGVGSVLYKGTPQIISNISGLGQLINAN